MFNDIFLFLLVFRKKGFLNIVNEGALKCQKKKKQGTLVGAFNHF